MGRQPSRLFSLPLPFAFVAVLLSTSAILADDASTSKFEITSPDRRSAIELSLEEGGRPV